MKVLLPILFSCAAAFGQGGVCTIDLKAPKHAGAPMVLYLFSDLLTDRAEQVTHATVNADGSAHLEARVNGTQKARLRVGLRQASLFLRPGAHYTISIVDDPNAVTTLGATAAFVPEFEALDRMDVNALVSDLNTRLDAFLAEGLATDADAGMRAATELRSTEKDSVRDPQRPPNIAVVAAPGAARVDSFEAKLKRFYAEVGDPWFKHYLEYSIAGLRFGPRTQPRTLFDRYVKDRPIHYDDPEQIRFLQNFFAQHLLSGAFRERDDVLRARVKSGSIDSVSAVLAEHPFLHDHAALRELVLLNELYTNYHGTAFDRSGIERILRTAADSAIVPTHRTIAANMLWDLTALRSGADFPSLSLRNADGSNASTEQLFSGPVCLMITATWCAPCEQELVAMEALHKEYGNIVRFAVISVDSNWTVFSQRARQDTEARFTWLYAGDDPLFMDQLRLRSVPAFLLLNGRTIAQNPAPEPSRGMAAILHRMKAEAEERERARFREGSAPKER